ncbi:MAG TPA: chemotaxis-specific protein-glutamate methyltransferase CheB [Methanoregulaceae archaeon]|jgi:two-component system chemotaxis response regulator CheB|nr:chemotaxis-specific protein-glutamate methyltransferase CheB [Methanoregulaceae archaeon]
MTRILIVDDSLFMRTILKDMLEKDPEFEVVGTANDGSDAIKKIGELSPDVMTLDIEMPKMDGLAVLKKKTEIPDFPKTLMLSSLTTTGGQMTKIAMELGADDFLLKPKDVRGVRGLDRLLKDKIHNLVKIRYKNQDVPRSTAVAEKAVLIGSSAGGPPMLDVLLSSIPAPLDAAMVITQHMPTGGFTASLATRLNRISSMPVKETENGDTLNAGHVYISKSGFHSIITAFIADNKKTGGRIVHSRAAPVHNVRPAVDRTFQSATAVFCPRCLSVILSGMGNDGGEGMAAIKQQGGRTMICREEDCLVYGMARSALARNCVDQVLPLDRMGDEISKVIADMKG